MRLNSLKPAAGSKPPKKRVGRGIGSGLGKTAGRGHKGLKSRAGGGVPVGFEGGQMPMQRRLPKVGFSSRVGHTTAEVRLHELNGINADVVDLAVLKAAGIVTQNMQRAKIMLAGSIEKAVTIRGVGVTKGARAAIEAAGGRVED